MPEEPPVTITVGFKFLKIIYNFLAILKSKLSSISIEFFDIIEYPIFPNNLTLLFRNFDI